MVVQELFQSTEILFPIVARDFPNFPVLHLDLVNDDA